MDAYIKQFKETRPTIQADMDSTLIQLDNLKSDIETHYLSDSLAAVYLEAETQHVTRLSNATFQTPRSPGFTSVCDIT